jgi:hypothetical protein
MLMSPAEPVPPNLASFCNGATLQLALSDQLVVAVTPGLPIQRAVLAAMTAGVVKKVGLTAARIRKRRSQKVYLITASILMIEAIAIVFLFNAKKKDLPWIGWTWVELGGVA